MLTAWSRHWQYHAGDETEKHGVHMLFSLKMKGPRDADDACEATGRFGPDADLLDGLQERDSELDSIVSPDGTGLDRIYQDPHER